jgi:2-desacetyl-2-hydroxyethyl bacteriochlorophyllide A dehydrogenase
MSDARAFWVTAPGRGEIRAETLDARRDGEVLVRAQYSGISRGTESLVFQGRVPPSENERMRAPFQSGAFTFPLKYGYASVGVVEEGPADLVRQNVFVLYPHQTRYVVPRAAVHVLPSAVPARRAVLTANLETAINGLWDADVQAGDRVTVVGAGTVGCLTAWLAGKVPGCEVELVDVNPARASVAKALGVSYAPPGDAIGERDVVVHASGSSDGLSTAIRLAGFEAVVVEMSWYGTRAVTIPLGESFHARRLTLRSSQVGHVPAEKRARWDSRRRLELALRLLDDDALDVLITGESDFERLPETMVSLIDPGTTLCHVIKYV